MVRRLVAFVDVLYLVLSAALAMTTSQRCSFGVALWVLSACRAGLVVLCVTVELSGKVEVRIDAQRILRSFWRFLAVELLFKVFGH